MQKTITVAKDGSGDFNKIQDAVKSIPPDNTANTVIQIKKGIYKEKLFIEAPNISLIGDDPFKTIITFDDYAEKQFADGSKYETFNSYSVFIGGNDFYAENITIQNTAGEGFIVGQAVAAYVDADRAHFKNCRIIGCQDTLFTGPLPPSPLARCSFGGPGDGMPRLYGRQLYEHCFIKGNIDFIFGSATAVFYKCEIFTGDRAHESKGFVSAPSTPEGMIYGYVFIECSLTGDAPSKSVYLGRPWRNYARSVYINCFMDKHIKDEGWDNWDKPECENTVFFAEYKSHGPGANDKKRANWSKILNDKEAESYKPDKILSGNDLWKPCP